MLGFIRIYIWILLCPFLTLKVFLYVQSSFHNYLWIPFVIPSFLFHSDYVKNLNSITFQTSLLPYHLNKWFLLASEFFPCKCIESRHPLEVASIFFRFLFSTGTWKSCLYFYLFFIFSLLLCNMCLLDSNCWTNNS